MKYPRHPARFVNGGKANFPSSGRKIVGEGHGSGEAKMRDLDQQSVLLNRSPTLGIPDICFANSEMTGWVRHPARFVNGGKANFPSSGRKIVGEGHGSGEAGDAGPRATGCDVTWALKLSRSRVKRGMTE